MGDEIEVISFSDSGRNYDVEEQKIISENRFIFLCLISFGIYAVWWNYKAWDFFRQKEKLDINPAARALFGIFFLFSLLKRILAFANEKGYQNNYSSSFLFAGVIITNLLSRLPDPYWVISIFSFVFLIPPFKALNFALQNSNDIGVSNQTSFSGRQIGLIVVGSIFWVIILIALNLE